jgi:hypothetical protein
MQLPFTAFGLSQTPVKPLKTGKHLEAAFLSNFV